LQFNVGFVVLIIIQSVLEIVAKKVVALRLRAFVFVDNNNMENKSLENIMKNPYRSYFIKFYGFENMMRFSNAERMSSNLKKCYLVANCS